MSSFHTKTIGRILDPVAQQVSKLILLFEDGGTAGETPDLANRISVVKLAVDNLVKVGYDTTRQSTDQLLKRDMPPALVRVEEASIFLQDSVKLLSRDPSSSIGRKKLIEGSRGILRGTSAVLITFDMSEVRKIIECCEAVLAVLSTVPEISSFPELAEFVKNLTPGMAQMIKEVDERQDELVIKSHAELLQHGIAQVKRITPILISSIKLFLNTSQQYLPAAHEAQLNRDYFLHQINDEIYEIIRGLQLTSSNDMECFGDHYDILVINRNNGLAQEWLSDPIIDSGGDKVIRQIIVAARGFETLCMSDSERNGLRELISDLESRVTQLVHARKQVADKTKFDPAPPTLPSKPLAYSLRIVEKDDASAVKSLGSACRQDLARLLELCRALNERTEHQNAIYRLARTLEGKVTQVQRWLNQPRGSQLQVGYEASRALVAQANQLIQMETEEGVENLEFQDSCSRFHMQTDQLFTMLESSLTSNAQAKQERELAIQAAQNLDILWHNIQHGLVRQVADYFTDLVGPIKDLQEATSTVPIDENVYQQAADTFLEHSRRVKRAANLAANNLVDPWRGSTLQSLASNLESVSSQVDLAGRVVMSSRQSGASAQLQTAASDHFDRVKKHWAECAERTRDLVDEAIDANAFIKAQRAGIVMEIARIEDSIDQHCPTSIVNGTTSIALRANRVLQVAKRETENSEDPLYVDRVSEAVQRLRSTITPMVADAKNMVLAMDDPTSRQCWRATSQNLVEAVSTVGQVVAPTYFHSAVMSSLPCQSDDEIPTDKMRQLYVQGVPNSGYTDDTSRPLSPETDIEDEFNYPLPEENQPILAAAHALHQEARLWSSRDNELIAATKRIAALMAKLSQIVRGEYGNKKDLINVSMAIAKASVEVIHCARALANECTDRRMKSSLFQLSERILMIGNQLKILSTVKATMLDSDDSPEDRENTEVLVGNAQNLMQAVIETVRVAESASIKMRVDCGYKIRWMPRPLINGGLGYGTN